VSTYKFRQHVTLTFVVRLILLQQILQQVNLIEKFLDEGENAQSITPTETSIILRPHPTNLRMLMREAWPY
jgi:hypothetical protein